LESFESSTRDLNEYNGTLFDTTPSNWQLSSIAELEKSSKYIPPERVVLWKICLSERKEDKSRMECPQTINKFQHLLFHGALGVSNPPPPV